MSYFYGLLPFIALALSRPGLAPELRLIALFALLALFVQRWAPVWRDKAADAGFVLAPVGLLLSLLAWGAMPERGLPYSGWPMMAAGMLFLFLAPESANERLRGAAAFCVTWWAAFAMSLAWPRILAMRDIWQEIEALYPPHVPNNPLEPVLPNALIFPPDAAPALFFNAALCLAFLLILVWASARRSLGERIAGGAAVFAFSAVLAMLIGVGVYVWVAVTVALTMVLTDFPSRLRRIKLVYVALLAVAMYWATHTLWNPFFHFTPLPILDWFWRARELFADAAAAYPVGATRGVTSYELFLLFSLGGVFLLQFARFARDRRVSDPEPLFLILALATIGGVLLAKPWQIFAQPLFWLALGLCAPRWESGLTITGEPLRFDNPLRAAPIAMAGLAVLVGLAGVHGISKEWRVESLLRSAYATELHGERLRLMEAAFRMEPRRGDAAAIYATEKILTHIRQNTIPETDRLLSMEVTLAIGARHGIVPVLGYKRLADLYLLKGDAQSALRLLSEAAERFPSIPVIRELYADLLEIVGRRDEALYQYRLCLDTQPTSVRLRRKIALSAQALGQTREARIFQESLRLLDPNFE